MIPNDLALRLRLLTESTVNPVAPVHEVTGELPELPVGQRFLARIEQALPDGTFRAMVAERNLTLALPESAKPGDTLELVVTARSPRLVTAQRAEALPAGEAPPATLSRAGQMIGTLFAGAEQPPQAATLSRATPLLPQPSALAAELAPALKQAIAASGLFYESHQAQWIAGRYPLGALRQEPQARQGRPSPEQSRAHPQAAPGSAAAGAAAGADTAAVRRSAAATGGPPAELVPARLQPLVQQQLNAAATRHVVWRGEIWPGQFLHWEIYESRQAQPTADRDALRQEPPERQRPAAPGQDNPPAKAAPGIVAADEAAGAEAHAVRRDAAATGGQPAEPVPAQSQPPVQPPQDAAATQQIVWRGEIGPGQFLQWEIEPDAQQRDAGADVAGEQWATRLKLALPNLGEIDAVLVLTPEKVSLRMTATTASTPALRQGFGELATALASAGLPALTAKVESQ